MATQPCPNVSWGPVMIGLIVASIFYGITSSQVYLYFTRYPNDARVTKLLAGTVWAIDTVALVLVCNGVYGYLISDINHPENRLKVDRSFDIEPALMGAMAFLTHSYLGLRVWKVCHKNFWLGLLLVTLSLLALGLSVVTSILSIEFWSERHETKWLTLVGMIFVVMADGLIASVLCIYLTIQKVEGKPAQRLVRRILVFTINTGLACSLMSIFNIVTLFALQHTLIFLGSNFIFTKVYANAVLANLNARDSLRGCGYLRDGMITLNWSALQSKRDDMFVLDDYRRSDGPGPGVLRSSSMAPCTEPNMGSSLEL